MKSSLRTKIKKSISWRIHGTLTTVIISYLYTGKLEIAGSIATTLMIIKTLLYIYHEKLWEHLEKQNKNK